MTSPRIPPAVVDTHDLSAARWLDGWRVLTGTIASDLSPDKLFERVCRDVVTGFGFSRSVIATVERHNHRLVARAGYDPNLRSQAYMALVRLFQIPLAPRPDGRLLLAAWCVERKEQAYVPDASADSFRPSEVIQRPIMLKALGTKEYVVTPIVYENRTVAILGVDKKGTGQRITEAELQLLRDVAQLLALRFGPMLDEQRAASRREERALLTSRDSDTPYLGAADSGPLRALLHDLLAPLQSMIGFAELLDAGRAGELTPEQKEFVGRIIGGGDELMRFIDRLLTIQSLDALAGESAAPVQAAVVVDRVFERLKGKAIHAHVGLVHTLNGEMLRGDANRIAAVFQNLVDNAIDSTEPGGAIRVSVEAASDAQFARFSVEQQGSTERNVPDMLSFEESWTDSGVRRRRRSHGLGLVIVRRIVESYGGELWAQGSDDGGLSVNFTLPAAPALSDAAHSLEVAGA